MGTMKSLMGVLVVTLILSSPLSAKPLSHPNRMARINQIIQRVKGEIEKTERALKVKYRAESHLNLMRLHLKIGQYDQAKLAIYNFIYLHLKKANTEINGRFFALYLQYLKQTYQYEKFLQVYQKASPLVSKEYQNYYLLMKLQLQGNELEMRRVLSLPGEQFLLSPFYRLYYAGIYKQKKEVAKKMLAALIRAAKTSEERELAGLYQCYFHQTFDIDYRKILQAADNLLADSTSPLGLLRIYSSAYYYLGLFSELNEILEKGARLDHYGIGFYYSLGNGQGRYNYEQIYQKYPQCFPGTTKEKDLLQKAKGLLSTLRYHEARLVLDHLKKINPNLIEIHMLEAEILRNGNQLYQAIELYRKVLALCPYYGRAFDGIAVTYWKIERSFRYDVEQVKKRFAALKIPEIPGVKKYLVNFQSLTPKMQKLLLLSIAHWKHFVPTLNLAGATFYIKPIYERLTDYPPLSHQKGQRESYNRLDDDIRGQGGYHAVMSIADLEQTLHGGYNTVLHEMTHQIHRILTHEKKKQIDLFYEKAMKEDCILSRYQSSNAWEYFAVAMDSYYDLHRTVDTVDKIPPRANVETRDPRMNRFIKGLLKIKDLKPYAGYAYLWKASQFLHKQKKIKEARVLLEKGYHLDPSNAEILEELVLLYQVLASQEKKEVFIDRGLEVAERLLKLDPHSYSALNSYGEVLYLKTLSYKKVVDFLKGHTDFAKVDLKAKAHVLLGEYLEGMGDLAQAASHYEKALKINPRDYFVMASLGGICALNGQVVRAEEWYKEAISLSPGYGNIRDQYVEFLLEQGRFKDALPHIGALRLKTNTLGKQDYLSGLLAFYKKKKYSEAAQHFQKVLKQNPKDYRAILYLVQIRIKQKKWREAEGLLMPLETRTNLRPLRVYVEDWKYWATIGKMDIREKQKVLKLSIRLLERRLRGRR